jgi:hypothetical protein
LIRQVRPRIQFYAGRYLALGAGFLFLLLFVMALAGGENAGSSLLALLAIGGAILAAAGYSYIAVLSTTLTISQGRLQIQKGIFTRRVTNIDLWRTLNIHLKQTFINRLTGDGTLILVLSMDPLATPVKRQSSLTKVIKVPGLASGDDLFELHQLLLNLAFLLRGNAAIKGIIQ